MSKKLNENMSVEEIRKKIKENRRLIMSMIIQKNAGTLKDTSKISFLKKDIARMLTKMNKMSNNKNI